MSINIVSISGNLTRDAELRTTSGGMPVLQFAVAVNERRKVGDSWEDYANFIDCTMFGKRAQAVAEYLAKGTKVAVQGKLHWSQWERNGEKRSKVEVIAEEIEFTKKQQTQQAQYVEPFFYDEDIPFN